VEGEKGVGRGAAHGKPFAAKPEPPEGGAGPAVNACILCFLFLLDAAPPPASSSSSPSQSPRRSSPTRLHFGPWPPR
jgi:hypothetical protein